LDATTGVLTLMAGNGTAGFSGDNGPATSAQLDGPEGVAVDSAGTLYIVDSGNSRIRKVSNGVIATVAGGGSSFGDNGPATSAQFTYPWEVAVDSVGNLYIADPDSNRIRKVSNGVITTVAGNGNQGSSGDNGPATSAQLNSPAGVAVDSAGNLYIGDTLNNRIRKVSNGVITTVAGNGTPGFSGDNGPATSAQLNQLYGVAVDSAGNLYVADTLNNRIRKVSSGVITTVAGNGTPSFSGDNGPATNAQLYLPAGVAVDSAGNLYIADVLNNRIRKVSGGMITTVGGGGSAFGDDVPATSAWLVNPRGVAVNSAGNLYLADTMNGLIREVSNGVIATVAGNRMQGFAGDNGPATSAPLYFPDGIAVDSAGDLYIADTNNNRIRKVSNGVITTVAGNGTPGFSGDNGPATSAQLSNPRSVAVDSAGNLYFPDVNRIRKVSNGVITTVAGNGTQGLGGDHGPAASAQLWDPTGVAVDSAGNLYIADTGNNCIRKVSNGVISTVAGNGTPGFSGDNGPATSAQLVDPEGVAVDSAGNVYIADSYNNRIRLLTPAAGTGQAPTIMSVVNAASYIGGPISPGEVVTIFGTGIGPATAAYATTDPATGKLTTMIGGVQVLLSGIAAPMIYASNTQVSAVVPYEMAFVANSPVSIEYAGESSNSDQLTVAAAAPGLFAQNSSGSGPGAILNQDNSLNGPGHAAAKGSIVQVYMTGEGQTIPQGITGAITTVTLPPPQVTPAPLLSIQVSINGQPANYTYAGEAPGMVAGVMQLNVQIPANTPSGPLSIQVSAGGNMSQNGITVSVQ
jgi:uncharacterized protein (TIGR03437 family)